VTCDWLKLLFSIDSMKSYSYIYGNDVKDFEIESLLPDKFEKRKSLKFFIHSFSICVSVLLFGLFLFEFAALVRFICGQFIVSSDVKDGITSSYTLRQVNYDTLRTLIPRIEVIVIQVF
jgi:hypothetical protein